MAAGANADGFLSVSQFAAREGLSRARVLQLLAAGRIEGAQRIGKLWAIPAASRLERRRPGRPRRRVEPVSALLRALARRYVWWLAPVEASRRPELVALQVMELGDYADVRRLEATLGQGALKRVLRHAEANRLSERSWTHWNHRLGLAPRGRVPPQPRRSLR